MSRKNAMYGAKSILAISCSGLLDAPGFLRFTLHLQGSSLADPRLGTAHGIFSRCSLSTCWTFGRPRRCRHERQGRTYREALRTLIAHWTS